MIENGDKATVESFSDLSSILQSPNHCREPGTLGRHFADRCSTMLTMLTKATTGTPHYMSPEMVAWLDLHGMTRTPSEPFGALRILGAFHFSFQSFQVCGEVYGAASDAWALGVCPNLRACQPGKIVSMSAIHESERQEHSEIDMLSSSRRFSQDFALFQVSHVFFAEIRANPSRFRQGLYEMASLRRPFEVEPWGFPIDATCVRASHCNDCSRL